MALRLQNFSDPMQEGNIFKFRVEESGVGKMRVFNVFTGRISETVRGPRFLLITNRKSHKLFHTTRKSLYFDELKGLLHTLLYQS